MRAFVFCVAARIHDIELDADFKSQIERKLAMRSMILLAFVALMTSLVDCFNAPPSVATNPTAAANTPPADSAESAHSFTEQDAPDLDPKLMPLVWRGTPEESRRRIEAGTADETTIYIPPCVAILRRVLSLRLIAE